MKFLNPLEIASKVLYHVPAMIAYWDADQTCVFSNNAYELWFGWSPTQMKGRTMKEVLGPIYEKNLPHIQGALLGEQQVFERQVPTPNGEIRETIVTYTPDIVEGTTRGFFVHVADVTILREREAALERAIRERDEAMAELRILRGLLSVCSFCKDIRDDDGTWHQMEVYISRHSQAQFSHGCCARCGDKHYGDILNRWRE